MFNWSQVDSNCPAVQYCITFDCGDCSVYDAASTLGTVIGTCSNSQHWRGSVHSVLLVVRSVASLGLLAIHAVMLSDTYKGMFRTSKRRH